MESGIYTTNKNSLGNYDYLFKIMPLFLKDENHGRTILTGITPFPLELSRKMTFVDCLLNKEYELKDIHSKKYP